VFFLAAVYMRTVRPEDHSRVYSGVIEYEKKRRAQLYAAKEEDMYQKGSVLSAKAKKAAQRKERRMRRQMMKKLMRLQGDLEELDEFATSSEEEDDEEVDSSSDSSSPFSSSSSEDQNSSSEEEDEESASDEAGDTHVLGSTNAGLLSKLLAEHMPRAKKKKRKQKRGVEAERIIGEDFERISELARGLQRGKLTAELADAKENEEAKLQSQEKASADLKELRRVKEERVRARATQIDENWDKHVAGASALEVDLLRVRDTRLTDAGGAPLPDSVTQLEEKRRIRTHTRMQEKPDPEQEREKATLEMLKLASAMQAGAHMRWQPKNTHEAEAKANKNKKSGKTRKPLTLSARTPKRQKDGKDGVYKDGVCVCVCVCTCT
jgi:hypothetical protein